MAIDRTAYNALVDDDGTNLTGSLWNKAAIAGVILDPVDTALAAIVTSLVRVRVHDSNASQTVNNVTWTTVLFATEDYDTDGMHSTSSNTGRLTVVTAGVYFFVGAVGWDTNATGQRRMRILKNTSTVEGQTIVSAAGGNTQMQVFAQIVMNAADYVVLDVYQDSGGARTIDRDAGALPKFSAMRLGGL